MKERIAKVWEWIKQHRKWMILVIFTLVMLGILFFPYPFENQYLPP